MNLKAKKFEKSLKKRAQKVHLKNTNLDLISEKNELDITAFLPKRATKHIFFRLKQRDLVTQTGLLGLFVLMLES